MHPNPFRSPPISASGPVIGRGSHGAGRRHSTCAAAGCPGHAARLPVPAPATVGTPVAGASTAAPLPLSSTLDADASPQFRTVVEALVAAMQVHQVPGAAIGLLAGDREEHATVGLASLSSLRPVTPETLFQIGSLTKTYTGTAIWRLIDEGVLALDAPVRTYISELRLMDEAAAAEVTVGNLLDHSAGWYGDEGTRAKMMARSPATSPSGCPSSPSSFLLARSSPTTTHASPSWGVSSK